MKTLKTNLLTAWRQARRRPHLVGMSLLMVAAIVLPAVPVRAANCDMGEDGNGDVIISETCTIPADTYNITRDFVVSSGYTVTAAGNTGAGTGVVINAGRNITIEGTLSTNGQGYASASGPGAGGSVKGGSHGGDGGNNSGTAYGVVSAPVTLGSGGLNAAGGGAIKLNATDTLTLSGSVTATGGSTGGCCGWSGGAGGSVWLEAATLAGTGTASAIGGNSTTDGGGAGGRVAVISTGGSVPAYTLQAHAGTASNSKRGAAGTIYTKSSSQAYGTLIVDNNSQTASAHTPQITTSETYDSVIIRKGGDYRLSSGESLLVNSGGSISGSGSPYAWLKVVSGSTLSFPAAATTVDGVDIDAAGTIDVLTDLTIENAQFLHYASTVYDDTLNSITVDSGAEFIQYGTTEISLAGDLIVESGGNLAHGDNSTTQSNVLDISAANINIKSGGTVDVDYLGYDATYGPGGGGGDTGGGYGGNGGYNIGSAYGSVTEPDDLGSGGLNSNGGGAVKLFASGTLTLNGDIYSRANNTGGQGGWSGGSGGSVWLQGASLAGSGSVDASGGNSTTDGVGAGGRISVVSTGGSVPSYDLDASAGTGPVAHGAGAGTVYTKSASQTYGTLVIDNDGYTSNGYTPQESPASQTYDEVYIRNGGDYRIESGESLTVNAGGTLDGSGSPDAWVRISDGGTLNVPSAVWAANGLDVSNAGTMGVLTGLTVQDATFQTYDTSGYSATLEDVTVASSGVFEQYGTNTLTLTGDFVVQSGGNARHGDNSSARSNVLDIAAVNIDIQASGEIDLDGYGYDQASGPGGGGGSTGGTHAGRGGNNNDAPYGLVNAPVELGSGGANSTGGGAVKLVASDTLTVNGTITAKGTTTGGCCGWSGGSGGSAWLEAATLEGSGTVNVDGGISTTDKGGGGGRIAVISTGGSIPGYTLQSMGGTGATDGAAGTIYTKSSTQTYGTLTVDNRSNPTTQYTPQVTASETYDQVNIKNGGDYRVPSGYSLTVATGGLITGSGSPTPEFIVDSGGILNLGDSDATGSLDLTNNGALGLSGDLEVTSGTFTVDGTISGGLTSLTVGSSGTFIYESDDPLFSGSTLEVQNGGTFVQNNVNTLEVTTVIVRTGGTITHADNATAKNAVVDISATDITVEAGGVIHANYVGYDASEGSGAGTDGISGGGAGYGAAGGEGYISGSPQGNGGSAYGSETAPSDLGSGGGNDGGTLGGSGGGAIKLAASGTFTLNGDINATGQAGTGNQAGGGSGGSVWLNNVGSLEGSGNITANGGDGAGNDTNGGGCGSGGRIRIYYNTKTWTGTATADTGCTGPRAGTDGSVSEYQNTPEITDISFTPAAPGTHQSVSVSATAGFAGGVRKIELYLDGTTANDLIHTCDYPADPASVTCVYTIGQMSRGTHTVTVYAYNPSLNYGTDAGNVSVAAQTTANSMTLSRLDAGATEVDFQLQFTLAGESTGNLIVTFPAGFTVTQGFTGLDCAGGGTVVNDDPAYDTTHLYGVKTACNGVVTLSGAQVTNPTAGEYTIHWSNDNGEGTVFITDDDAVSVTGNVDPTLTFDIDIGDETADDTAQPYAIDFGQIDFGTPKSSDNSTYDSIWLDFETNGTEGGVITVRSANGSLKSQSTADQIASSGGSLAANTEEYGICVDTVVGTPRSGHPGGTAWAAQGSFNTTCTSGATMDVGQLTTSDQAVMAAAGPLDAGRVQVRVGLSTSVATPAHPDYQDILTFIATSTY